jgi:hypothetical protein
MNQHAWKKNKHKAQQSQKDAHHETKRNLVAINPASMGNTVDARIKTVYSFYETHHLQPLYDKGDLAILFPPPR